MTAQALQQQPQIGEMRLFEEGRKAALNGESRVNCPYAMTDVGWDHWVSGYDCQVEHIVKASKGAHKYLQCQDQVRSLLNQLVQIIPAARQHMDGASWDERESLAEVSDIAQRLNNQLNRKGGA